LEYLNREHHVDVTYIENDPTHDFSTMLSESIQSNTKLIVVNHASNITGYILPLKELGTIAKNAQIPLLVDASQTAGHLPIHMAQNDIDMLVFPGHKGMLGPQGTGVLLVNGNIDLEP